MPGRKGGGRQPSQGVSCARGGRRTKRRRPASEGRNRRVGAASGISHTFICCRATHLYTRHAELFSRPACGARRTFSRLTSRTLGIVAALTILRPTRRQGSASPTRIATTTSFIAALAAASGGVRVAA